MHVNLFPNADFATGLSWKCEFAMLTNRNLPALKSDFCVSYALYVATLFLIDNGPSFTHEMSPKMHWCC